MRIDTGKYVVLHLMTLQAFERGHDKGMVGLPLA
jgi:hypothetical protein